MTFAREAEWKSGCLRILQRNDQQFHWYNRGYGCFEDFLFLSTRVTARRSGANGAALADGITIHAPPATTSEDAWDAFFAFYMETGSRKWANLLTRGSFR